MNQTTPEAVVHRFYDSFLPGHSGLLPEILSPDWVDHTLPPGRAPGLPGMQVALAQLHGLLPDLKTTIIKMIPKDDMVAVHLVFTGTHEGAMFGAPPSHRPIRFIAFDLHHVSGDQIVESWHLEDNLGLLTQIGALPPLG